MVHKKIAGALIAMILLGLAGYGASRLNTAKAPFDYTPGKAFQDCDDCPEMLVIPGTQKFMMGQAATTPDADVVSQLLQKPNELRGPVHAVAIGTFAIGRMEVNQRQWKSLMGENPTKEPACTVECPVANVSWNDIQAYLEKLNLKTGKNYRLPSESEWEYAASAGKSDAGFEYGDPKADEFIWHAENGEATLHPIGQKKANAFNLHDTLGNVWEWVADCFHKNYDGAPSDATPWFDGAPPAATCTSNKRVVRGGSVVVELKTPRDRGGAVETRRGPDLGFRVALDIPATAPSAAKAALEPASASFSSISPHVSCRPRKSRNDNSSGAFNYPPISPKPASSY